MNTPLGWARVESPYSFSKEAPTPNVRHQPLGCDTSGNVSTPNW
jgi:hypothetical protein